MNALQGIIRQLKDERARVDAALRALGALGTMLSPRTHKRHRKLSAAARARIAAAQRARWAKVKRAKKH